MELSKAKTGRPLSFDRQAALKQAMLLFWQYGYEATSLSNLTKVMQISPPSLYTAFSDKKRLFLEAVEMYRTRGTITLAGMLKSAPTAHAAIATLLQGVAHVYTDPNTPAGCMLVSSATNCSEDSRDVQDALAKIRLGNEKLIRQRIQIDIDKGELPAATNADTLGALYMAIVQGMAVQARDGAKRSKLKNLAELAIQAWPD